MDYTSKKTSDFEIEMFMPLADEAISNVYNSNPYVDIP